MGTEHRIQEALREVIKGRTTFVIAHRLSTVIDADEIVVLEDGRVVERGSHTELLVLGESYARMWIRQQEAEKAKATLERTGEALRPAGEAEEAAE